LIYFENNQQLDAQAFKNLTGLSRKFAIPILEFLDQSKFTVRVGDARMLRKKLGKGATDGG
jgi:selenocysteine-specific elongation factor